MDTVKVRQAFPISKQHNSSGFSSCYTDSLGNILCPAGQVFVLEAQTGDSRHLIYPRLH